MKINKIILPIMYTVVFGVMIFCSYMIYGGVKSYISEAPALDYGVSDVFNSDVINVSKTSSDIIVKPYISSDVKVLRYFYDINSDTKHQESSIIYYNGSYIQNNGIDYSSEEDFDVVSVLDGEVIGIEDSEIYGKVITIKHNDNLITKYSNVEKVLINVGYKVTQGEIIASSTKSKIDDNKLSTLHFEMVYKGKNINPEKVYTLSVSELE